MKSFPLQLILLAMIPISFSFLPGNQSDSTSLPGLRANRVILFRAVPFEVRPGRAVILEGSGFSKTLNKVYLNGRALLNVASVNGTTLAFVIPASVSPGQYNLSVSNVFGSSEDPNIQVSLKVTNEPMPPPMIKSAFISGETVTLVGTGFTSSNQVATTLGNTTSPIASVGESLSFKLSDLSLYQGFKTQLNGVEFALSLGIFVSNEHGTSQNPYNLDINI